MKRTGSGDVSTSRNTLDTVFIVVDADDLPLLVGAAVILTL